MPTVLPCGKISRSKIIIYELEVYTYNSSSKRYPVEIDTIEIGRYSSLEKAGNEMKEWIEPCPPNQDGDYEVIHSFSIQEHGIDVPIFGSSYDERIYNDRGKLYGIEKHFGEPFFGTAPEDCRFKKGDVVEFRMYNELEIGIVTRLPLTPDRVSKINARYQRLYDEGIRLKDLDGNSFLLFLDQSDNSYIIHHGRNDMHEAVLSEACLFRPKFPISAETRKRLNAKYKYENGIFASFDTVKSGYKYGLELNNYMLGSFKDPHVIIFDCYFHLVVSLESYKILKGNPGKFDMAEINKIIKLIKVNEEDLRSGFRKMVEKCENEKDRSI